MKSKSILAAVISLLVIAACSSDTTTQPSATASFTVGTKLSILDSTSGLTSRNQTFIYDVVKATPDTLAVMQEGTTDTTYYRMQPNGDFYMYPQPSLSRNDWFLMPFGRQSLSSYGPEKTVSGSDTTYTTTTAIGEGSGTYTLGGKSYDTKKVRVTIVRVINGSPDTAVTHWAYASSLGYWVSKDDDAKDFLGTPEDVDHQRLTSIVRK